MEKIQKIFAALLLPIAIIICLVVMLFTSLLWIPYLIVALFDKVLEKELPNFWLNILGEFIFACYGFAACIVILPMSVIDEDY